MADEPMSDEQEDMLTDEERKLSDALSDIIRAVHKVELSDIERLRTENAALLAEVERLRTEFTAASHLIVRLTEHAEDSTHYQPSALIQEARAWVDSHTSD